MFKKIIGFIVSILLLTGCSSINTDIIDKLKNKVNKLDSYQIDGILEVVNNEATYKYDITVAYQKGELYKVKLKNKTNDHEQVILKNKEGVYVLTPSLNKSFKFQSEWPYNNSTCYLYQTLINDIENDDAAKVEKNNDGYIINTKANYSNSKDLKTQKIYLDKDAKINKVEVLDKNGVVKIKMTYKNVKHNKNFNDDYFKLSSNIEIKDKLNTSDKKTINELDIAYPLYIPSNTKLESQDVVSSENGDRTILTFGGEDQFTIIEETTKKEDTNKIINVNGELEFVSDVIGIVDDKMVSFDSNGISYYAVSKTLDSKELLEVLNSISVIPVGK